jgi:acetyltransferase-like isoleucine patch superfamily enzyme
MANVSLTGVHADDVTVGKDVRLGNRARLIGKAITLHDGAAIGDDVTISCDVLELGRGSVVGDGTHLIAPQIHVGDGSRIGRDVSAEINERLVLGRLCDIGRSVRIVAHAIHIGDHLWLTDSVRIGGGGARSPDAQLTIGDRCAVMDHCFINLSAQVSIGDDTALSNGVTVLTHSLWQPLLEGGTAQFAPVHIGSRCILYVNAVVAPGITIGDDVTVAAGALVMQNVPDGSTAVGNPARVMRSTPAVPRAISPERQDQIVRDILRAWAGTLPVKGVTVSYDSATDSVTTVHRDMDIVWYSARLQPSRPPQGTTISLAFGERPTDTDALCHIDLLSKQMSGRASPIAEDLRDFLRRRTIRIYTDQPFQPLAPATIDRLRRQIRVPR